MEERAIENRSHTSPYDHESFALIGRLAWQIKRRAKKQRVPAIGVAGSIADEDNVQRGALRRLEGTMDCAQWLSGRPRETQEANRV